MKFFHLSDLHIGKQLNGYSLRENQEAVLSLIISYAKKEKPDAILICGDIYDKSVPSGEAFTIFDTFLSQLAELQPEIPVLIIAGNHDSPERLQYAASFLEKHRIYISAAAPKNEGEYLKKVVLKDSFGEVNFYLFPFIKPGYVRPLFKEGTITSYESAFQAVLKRENIDFTKRNVILAHQFFTARGKQPETCESEMAPLTAGGLDQIDAAVLEGFEYGALGHLHGSQCVLKEEIRYCGTPYKYSASEANHKKSITMVTLEEKGEPVKIERLPLTGVQDVRRVTGSLEEVLQQGQQGINGDFVSIILTDEDERFDFRERLEEVYKRILEIRIDNKRTRMHLSEEAEEISVLNPFDAFCQFYEAVRHCPLTEEQAEFMKKIVEEAGEGEG